MGLGGDQLGFRFLHVLNTLTHLLIGGVTIVCCIFAYDLNTGNSYSQHIILCVVGYILLMCEATLSFSQHNSWSQLLSYEEKKASHAILQIAGSALAIAGNLIRILAVNNHFNTPHGIAGWLAFILTVASLIGGIVNLRVTKYGRFFKASHSLVAIASIACAVVCLCYGYDKNGYRNWSSNSTVIMIIFTVLAFVGSVTPACIQLKRRIFG